MSDSHKHDPSAPYVTKDASVIRELLHPSFVPGLGMSLAEAVVEAGGATLCHTHTDFDEIYYCLEGSGILYRDGEAIPFHKDGFHLLPKGTSHSLLAHTRLRLLCVCCPGYTHEKTILLP